MKKSEKEVLRYAKESGGRYLGFIQCFQPYIDVEFEGVEVFSLIRESDLSPTKYVDRFFDTGTERQRT